MSFPALIFHEFKALFSNSAILLTVFGGVILYSFLYPLPYAKQVPRDQNVVVVNLDNSQLSRKLERMVNATPQVALTHRAHSIDEAKKLFVENKLAGILVIPEYFYKDLMLGRQPTLSYAGDASYFLVYGTVVEGMVGAGGTLTAGIKINKMVISGQSLSLAKDLYNPVHLNIRAVFNPSMGYVNYVIPAIFVLILHHTLIMGIGMLGGTHNEINAKGISGYWNIASPFSLILARTCVFLSVYWLLCMYYFGFTFQFYSIPHHAAFQELNLIIFSFLLATSQLGIFLGFLLPRRELVTLLLLLSSLPLIFGAGFIWPTESIPDSITAVIQFVPVVPAIKLFLLINQMSCSFADAKPLINQLLISSLFFFVLSLMTILYKNSKNSLLKQP